ncbi:MAG: FG-GAP repeat protein [Planctomycetota bacterium]
MQRIAFASLLFSLAASSASAQAVEVDKLNGSGTNASDLFGQTVSICRHTTLIGAPQQAGVGLTSGAAYIHDRQPAGTWTETVELTPADAAAGDRFGRAVHLYGYRGIIGAPGDDGGAGDNEGSAYIFDRMPDGSWVESAKLIPSTPVAWDEFGSSVALSGNYAAVGAWRNDDIATDAGKVYVFERQLDGSWLEVAALTASDASEDADFGWSLSMSTTTLFVGADRQDAQGAVYVFERNWAGAWNETQKISALDAHVLDYFGHSVSVLGNHAIVGAPNAEGPGDPLGDDRGAAYIYERIGGFWQQVARIEASDASQTDDFGYSVGMYPGRAVIGAWNDDPVGNNSGSAYVFERQPLGGAWTEVDKMVPADGFDGDLFGYAIGIWSTYIVVGARNDDDLGSSSGSAYIFQML